MIALPRSWSALSLTVSILGASHGFIIHSFAAEPTAGLRKSSDEHGEGKEEKLAALYLKLGKVDQCRAVVNTLLRKNPRDVNAQRLLAKVEFLSGNSEAAAKAASVVLASSPQDVDALIIKSSSLAKQGKTEESNQLLAHLSPAEVADHKEALARILNGGAQPPGVTDAEAANEEAQDTALDAARKALEDKDLKKAGQLTEDALKRWPDNRDAATLRADYLAQTGRSAEAVGLLEKLKASHDAASGPFPGQLDLAYALLDAGRKQEAAKAFEAVVAEKRYSAKDRELASRVLSQERMDSLLDQGDKALDRGDTAEASRINDMLQDKGQSSPDAERFKANVLKAKGKPLEAVNLLSAMKDKTESGKRFDGQLDYASALAASHRYQAASAAYREILSAAPGVYTEEERKEAQSGLRDMHDNNPPGMLTELSAGRFDEGRIWRAKAQFFSGSYGSTRYEGTVAWDGIDLSKRLFPNRKSTDRTSATVGATEQFSREWSGSFAAGGFDHGAMASVMGEYVSPNGFTASLRGAYNDPARDTLLLEALDGRQNAITANFASPIGKYFAVDATLLARQVTVDQHDIGTSWGGEAQFRWHPFTVSRDIYLAYALEVKQFDGKANAFDRDASRLFGTHELLSNAQVYDAVPRNINRHALQAHAGSQLTASVKGSITGELVWRAEASKWEAGVASELLWSATSSFDVSARLEYSSGGAGPNTNGEVILSTLGLRWYW